MLEKEVDNALTVLQRGGTILYPTDTIWGIGCDATNEEAVSEIYNLKKRNDSKALIILIASTDQLYDYVEEIPELAWDLMEYATSPLTIIYPKAKRLASNLVAEDGSIAIRWVKDPFCQRLINRLKKPLVSTSANVSGAKPTGIFAEVSEEIKTNVDYVVDWRRNEKNTSTASKIIKVGMKGEVKIVRG